MVSAGVVCSGAGSAPAPQCPARGRTTVHAGPRRSSLGGRRASARRRGPERTMPRFPAAESGGFGPPMASSRPHACQGVGRQIRPSHEALPVCSSGSSWHSQQRPRRLQLTGPPGPTRCPPYAHACRGARTTTFESEVGDDAHCLAEAAHARRTLQDQGWSNWPTWSMLLDTPPEAPGSTTHRGPLPYTFAMACFRPPCRPVRAHFFALRQDRMPVHGSPPYGATKPAAIPCGVAYGCLCPG